MKRVTQHNERHPVCHNWINFSYECPCLDAWLPRKKNKKSPYSPAVILVPLSVPHRPHSPVIIFPFCLNKPSATIQILAWGFCWFVFLIFSPYIYIFEKKGLDSLPRAIGSVSVFKAQVRMERNVQESRRWDSRFLVPGGTVLGAHSWEWHGRTGRGWAGDQGKDTGRAAGQQGKSCREIRNGRKKKGRYLAQLDMHRNVYICI